MPLPGRQSLGDILCMANIYNIFFYIDNDIDAHSPPPVLNEAAFDVSVRNLACATQELHRPSLHAMLSVVYIHRNYLCRGVLQPASEVPCSRQLAKKAASFFYLHHPNECFQLVNVKLQVHPVGQPGADDIHGAVVPLLKERQKCSRQHVMEGRQRREGTGHICAPALPQREQDG